MGEISPRLAESQDCEHHIGRTVRRILESCVDLSADSDEPVSHARGWAQHFHLSPDRANLLRALDVPSQARVLEIGAGAGALTRYLGERHALVDALEPDPELAGCAILRTRDLASVRVVVGDLADVPAVPAYDVVVVVDSLERLLAAEGIDQIASMIDDRLADGGSLVLASANKLGVKYLVGAADGSTERAFATIEGYPREAGPRSLDRRHLLAALNRVGLTPELAVAFPDHRFTRTVLRPDLISPAYESLLHRVPSFPSPDREAPRIPLADEGLVWRSLVGAGLAADTGNSFLILATKGRVPSLWPRRAAGVYYSVGRRRKYFVESVIDMTDDPPVIRRRGPVDRGAARSSRQAGSEPSPVLEVVDQPLIDGQDLTELIVDLDDLGTVELLQRWAAMVRDAARRDGDDLPLDLRPQNLIVRPDGEVVFIDDEWRLPGATPELILGRGALYVGMDLQQGPNPGNRWAGQETIGDVVTAIGRVVGLGDEGDWLDDVVEQESRLQVAVTAGDGGQSDDDRARSIADLIRQRLGTPVRSPLDIAERLDVVHSEVAELRELSTAQAAQNVGLRAENDARAAEIDVLRAEQRLREVEYAAQGARLASLELRISLLRAEFDTLKAEESAARRERDVALVDAGRAADEVEAIRTAFSWRVTAPIRAARQRAASVTGTLKRHSAP